MEIGANQSLRGRTTVEADPLGPGEAEGARSATQVPQAGQTVAHESSKAGYLAQCMANSLQDWKVQ